MLVLTRYPKNKMRLKKGGDEIIIEILKVFPSGKVRIAVTASTDWDITRDEAKSKTKGGE